MINLWYIIHMIVWQIIMEEWNYIDLPEIGTLMHRITPGNCSPPCSGGSGSTKRQSGFRPWWRFAPPQFFAPVKRGAFSLSGAKNRQLPVTLYDIMSN